MIEVLINQAKSFDQSDVLEENIKLLKMLSRILHPPETMCDQSSQQSENTKHTRTKPDHTPRDYQKASSKFYHDGKYYNVQGHCLCQKNAALRQARPENQII